MDVKAHEFCSDCQLFFTDEDIIKKEDNQITYECPICTKVVTGEIEPED